MLRLNAIADVAAMMSTAGNLIFGGDIFGEVWALDATNGKKLWSFNIGTVISSAPVSFAVDGRQFVAVSSGLNPIAVALAKEVLTEDQVRKLPPVGATLYVFALPKTAASASP